MDEQNSLKKDKKRVGLLLMAHGSGIAKNTAKVANSLLETEHTHALTCNLRNE